MLADETQTFDDGVFAEGDDMVVALGEAGQFAALAVHHQSHVAVATTHRLLVDSDHPLAWGTITSIDENTISLGAPDIEPMPVSGKQSVELASGAEFFHLGKKLDDEQRKALFAKGVLIRVYPARPQTIVINDDRPETEWGDSTVATDHAT